MIQMTKLKQKQTCLLYQDLCILAPGTSEQIMDITPKTFPAAEREENNLVVISFKFSYWNFSKDLCE